MNSLVANPGGSGSRKGAAASCTLTSILCLLLKFTFNFKLENSNLR